MRIDSSRRVLTRGLIASFLLAALFCVSIGLHCVQLRDPDKEYALTLRLFREGHLPESQLRAQWDFETFRGSSPDRSVQFLILEAEALAWQGMNEDVLRVLSPYAVKPASLDQTIQILSMQGAALAHLQDFKTASQKLDQASADCAAAERPVCADLLRAKGVLEVQRGHYSQGHQYFLDSLHLSQRLADPWLEATALLNLGVACLQEGRPDEAVDWSRSAHRAALSMNAGDLEQNATGNLGWAYFRLGDQERARQMFLEVEKRAGELGDLQDRLLWLAALGYVETASGKIDEARGWYQKALAIASEIDSKGDIADILTDLGQVAVASGNADEADSYAKRAMAMAEASGNKADWYDDLAIELQAAALRGDTARAEKLLKDVEAAPESQTSMKWASEHAMAAMHERRGEVIEAEHHYQAALAIFAAARAEISKDDSELPFLTNATRIFDDYIHFLVAQGKTDEALAVADESRARTLAQGLGVADKQRFLKPEVLGSGLVARRAGATVLFYWLGDRQSYLWAVAPSSTKLFTLPPQSEIASAVEHYRKALLEPAHARGAFVEAGESLYRMLVEPAAGLLRANGDVAIVCDGPLSLLNFETLTVPGPTPHYFIEDANIVSAPSLSMLAASHRPRTQTGRLLLMGDAISPNPDYPDLPMAAQEMHAIAQHFRPAAATVFSHAAATSDAYTQSAPAQYSYIHFVAHGVASRTEPLDSAIILSRTSAAEDSFKLHAREIIRHPLDARLVTISACYGGGTRSYAGEGLVGLSWAFLRAGAHNVIGALWEASDDSTPQLMDSMYAGIEKGLAPSAALRNAKLALLHSGTRFRDPFYWAPFQIYAGL